MTLSFGLKAEALRGSELGLIASFGVSQWAEAAVRCVLKGGSPPPAQPEMAVLLRGFIAAQSAESLDALLAQDAAAAPAKKK